MMLMQAAQPAFSTVLIVLVAVSVVAAIALLVVVSRLLVVCPPNEVIVISGRTRVLPDGSTAHYRIVRGGRVLRVPLLETVDRLSLVPISVTVSVNHVILGGGKPQPIVLEGVVRIDPEFPRVQNAVERWLGKERSAIARVVESSLEGALRALGVSLKPEDFTYDRDKIAMALIDASERDLAKLGLVIETLTVQRVGEEIATYRR